MGTRQSAQQMLGWFCQRRVCRRGLTRPLTLSIGEVGNVTVRPFEEPAYVIERFSSAATAAGLQMNVETMLAALEWFCARRSCHRRLTGPWTLQLDVANVTVRPFEEPAAIVEVFGAKAQQAGLEVDEEMLQQILNFFCERRSCHRPLNPALEINVPDLGTLKVAPHEDPADAVEQFALVAMQKGLDMTGKQMVEMLTLICEQRQHL